MGAFIVATRPRNPIGWLFSAVGLLWLSGEVVYDWALGVTDSSDPFLPYASLYAASYWIPGLGLLFVAVMLFPSGRLPSPGWRPAFVLVVTGLTLAFARAALAMEVRAGDDGLVVDNPIGLGFLGLVTTRRRGADAHRPLHFGGHRGDLLCGSISTVHGAWSGSS